MAFILIRHVTEVQEVKRGEKQSGNTSGMKGHRFKSMTHYPGERGPTHFSQAPSLPEQASFCLNVTDIINNFENMSAILRSPFQSCTLHMWAKDSLCTCTRGGGWKVLGLVHTPVSVSPWVKHRWTCIRKIWTWGAVKRFLEVNFRKRCSQAGTTCVLNEILIWHVYLVVILPFSKFIVKI